MMTILMRRDLCLSPNRGLNAEGILRRSPNAAVAAPAETDALVCHARRRVRRCRRRPLVAITVVAVVLLASAAAVAKRRRERGGGPLVQRRTSRLALILGRGPSADGRHAGAGAGLGPALTGGRAAGRRGRRAARLPRIFEQAERRRGVGRRRRRAVSTGSLGARVAVFAGHLVAGRHLDRTLGRCVLRLHAERIKGQRGIAAAGTSRGNPSVLARGTIAALISIQSGFITV